MFIKYKVAIASVLALSLQGCTAYHSEKGTSGSSTSTPLSAEDESPKMLSCDTRANGKNETVMRRLSKQEIVNSLTDLFGASLIAAPNVNLAIQKIPDQITTSPAKFDNSIPDVEGLFETAQAIVDEAFQNDTTIGSFLPGCKVATPAACLSPLLDRLAYRAFRRPVTQEVKQELTTLVNGIGGIEGVKSGVIRILVSPFFNQHVEIGEDTSPDATRIKLTQFEVASRLSFSLTGSIPDQALLDAAAAGQLTTTTALRGHAQRLIASQQARRHWSRFISDWLQLQKVTDPSPLTAVDAGFTADGFGDEARQEALRFAEYILFDKKGTLSDLYTDKTVFATTDRLAAIYQVPKSEQPQRTPAAFAGVVLRPAKLMSANAYTSPILRGVYIRKRILCDEIPSPSGDVVTTRLNELDKISHDGYTNREITTQVTAGSSCMGCHTMINPIGFALETFGPAGLPQPFEKVWSTSGPTGKTHNLNTYVEDLKLSQTRAIPALNAFDLNDQLARNAKTKECFSKKLVEQTRFRPQDQMDACVLNTLNSALQARQPLVNALVEAAVYESIFWKSVQGVQL